MPTVHSKLEPIGKPMSRRTRYTNEFKMDVLREIEDGLLSIGEISRHYAVPESTIRDWRKCADVIKQSVHEKKILKLKANHSNAMPTLSSLLNSFVDATEREKNICITSHAIIAQALKYKKLLLNSNDISESERNHLEQFHASPLWAKI